VAYFMVYQNLLGMAADIMKYLGLTRLGLRY